MSEIAQGPSKAKFYFHLKRAAVPGETRKPSALGHGTLYLTLCGHWVYDSIAADVDCPDRWVTCPTCAKQDPNPEFQCTPPPRWE